MVEVINELVEKKKLPSAQVYTDFGVEQLKVINEQAEQWLKQQSFSDEAPSPQYNEMKIRGYSNNSEIKDQVEWDLRFKDPLKTEGLGRPDRPGRALSDGLLHIKRYPKIKKYNSAPRLFDTADYIRITVSNSETGWVAKGEFPVNTHVDSKLKIGHGFINPKYETINFAVFTDIKRDAKVGFIAAREWAKFRTMAITCSEYIRNILQKEWENVKTFNERELMRSRTKKALALMLDLLPDTRTKNGKTSLKKYYKPGILEATAALELEKGFGTTFGTKDIIAPIYGQKGYPIEITSIPGKKGEYEAVLYFDFHIPVRRKQDNETAQTILEKELQKYFDITLKNTSDLSVKLHLANAHKVRSAIYEGADNTPLHSEIDALLDAIRNAYTLLRSWGDEQIPVLEKGYQAMVEAGKQEHFGRLEHLLSWNPKTRPYRKKD